VPSKIAARESPESLYQAERARFNKSDPAAPPGLGISLSGGGNRSAAFSIGVVRALHQKGLLSRVDVISAVSGGSYALSWYLLQPFYYALGHPDATLREIQNLMLDAQGPFQRYLENNAKPLGALDRLSFVMQAALAGAFTGLLFNVIRVLNLLLSRVPGMQGRLARHYNAVSSIRQEYRAGIQRTYQMLPDESGTRATNNARADFAEYQELLKLSAARPPVTFPLMSAFAQRIGLPAFVFNATVRSPRTSASGGLRHCIFELGAAGFGSDACGFVAWEQTDGFGWEPGMPRKGWDDESSLFATLRSLNTAPAISGAAVSDAGVEQRWARWLLNIANFGLEYLVPDPSDLRRTLRLSDGGHSENLGAYALLRRGCRTVVIVDAEYEPARPYAFEAYHRLKAAVKADFGMDLLVQEIEDGGFAAGNPICRGHASVSGQPPIRICYLKLSMDPASLKDETGAIQGYVKAHAAFPHESTADQYFTDARFRAYVALGHEIASGLPDDLDAG
jgi:hypothetical protein